jgi:radical SAM protein with 4Fe4S-binding SPASM domain
MAGLIAENCNNSELAIITSGYESAETEKRSRLLRMIEVMHGKQFLLALSYNLFSNYEKRMRNVLRDLAFQDHDLEVFVKMCMSAENDKETVKSFAHLLVAVAKENDLPEISYCGSISWGIHVPEYLREQLYVLHGPKAEIRMQTKLWGLKREGRAKRLKEVSFMPSVCELLSGNAERSLTLYPDGYFYPCDACVGIHKRRLGHIMDDPLRKISSKRDAFVKKVRKYMLPLWKCTGTLPCALCKMLPQ